jgi:energy-coupling factor transporter ATP-binding protein EcfA2
MEMMADLAHDGRTVIVVTHSVANLNLCDRLLVLVPGGKVAYFGPPAEGLAHFGQPGWGPGVRAAGRRAAGGTWPAEYPGLAVLRPSTSRRTWSGPRPVTPPGRGGPGRPGGRPGRDRRLAQLSTLCPALPSR